MVVQTGGPAQAPCTEMRSTEVCVHETGVEHSLLCSSTPELRDSSVPQAVGMVLAQHRTQWEKAGLERSNLTCMRLCFFIPWLTVSRKADVLEGD